MNDSGPCTLRSSTTLDQVNSSVRLSPVSGNSAGSSPIGATGPKSTTSARPLLQGSRTARAKAAATTASTAVPPAARISAPTCAAAPFCDATTPPLAETAGLRTSQFCVRPSMSGDLDRIDPVAVEGIVPGKPLGLVIGALVAPDGVFRALAAEFDRPIRGGALERAIGRVLGLFHQIEPHVLRRDVVDRAVARLLDAQGRGAVGNNGSGEADAHAMIIGMKIDAMLGLLDPARGGVRHGRLLSRGLGGRRLAPVRGARLLVAIERGDAVIVKLRALQRTALLLDPVSAERFVGAGERLVLLARPDVLLRRLVDHGRVRRGADGGAGERQREQDWCVPLGHRLPLWLHPHSCEDRGSPDHRQSAADA